MGTTLPSIVAGDGADVATTANFRAVAPAGMYGTNPATTSGLTWGYFGGTWGPGTDIDNGAVVVGASTTTYVVASRSTGAVSNATSTTNWNDSANYLRIAVLVSGTSGITSITDHRPSVYNSTGGGGGGSSTFIGLTDTFSSYAGRAGLNPQVNAAENALITPGVPVTKSASFTFALADNDGSEVQTTGATNVVATVPPNSSVAFPIGTGILLHRTGTGSVTLAAGAGVTLNSEAGLVMGGGRSLVALQKVAADTWEVKGELAGNSPVIVQTGYAEYTANADISTIIPADDSIPQNTEGTQILSVTITPRSVTNKIRMRFAGQFSNGAAAALSAGAAMFWSGSSNAIQADWATITAQGFSLPIACEVDFVPGVTTPITLTVRVGPLTAGTIRMNGTHTGRFFGGASRATLIVEEIAA